MINKFNSLEPNFLKVYVEVVLIEILKVSSPMSNTTIVKKINEDNYFLDFIDENFINRHKKSYEEFCGDLERYRELSSVIAKNIKILNTRLIENELKERIFSLQMLILMPPNVINEISGILKNKNCGFTSEYFINKYNELRSHSISDEYVKKLNVLMCPYCNINDISISDENYKFQSKYQIDHFLDKADYPILALSIYNLIPVCQKCNHIKLNKSLNTNPYLAEEDDVLFLYNNLNELQKIELMSKNEEVEKDIDVLELSQRYNTKYSIIKKETEDLFNMCNKYNESYEKLNSLDDGDLYKDFKYWQKSTFRDGLIKENDIKNNRLSKVKNSIVKTGIGLDKYQKLIDN